MALYIILLPLLGGIITGLLSGNISNKLAGWLNSTFLVITALIAAFTFYQVTCLDRVIDLHLFNWLELVGGNISWSIHIDALGAIMLLVVTIVSALVHIYSTSYMHDDPHMPRFMAYLSLFTFFMLMLVTADNLMQLFFGWEGVGLCSYLLIGFWYHKDSACNAAIKAFIVNRVADVFFVIGIFSLYYLFDSLNFSYIFAHLHMLEKVRLTLFGFNCGAAEFIAFMLFVGCMGKSAQIFFHTWLADAMEGPTPVSALIHAATMVTAGVFLIARLSPLFELAPAVLSIITFVGAITAFLAASIALVQNDIKKIIAYSTCSQLGYMFIACGVSAYPAAIFHLYTHAFFKALLFLGAGSVIHAVSGEQDIRKMGGLWKKLPITYCVMWIGSLAICGVWPFAGYFSKDAILEAVFVKGTEMSEYAYSLGLCAAIFTAFYSFRLLFLTFHGQENFSKKIAAHVHEGGLAMKMPLLILAIGAVSAGYIGEKYWHLLAPDLNFWRQSIVIATNHNLLEQIHNIDLSVKFTPTIAGLIGFMVAYLFYIKRSTMLEKLYQQFEWLYAILLHKYYVDEIYQIIIVEPLKRIANYLSSFIEVKYIDGMGPNGVARLVTTISGRVAKLQTGYIYHYALAILLGLIFFSLYYIITFIN